MKKNKFGCLKYIIFAGAIILLAAYMFTILAPKSSQEAKKEVLENVFGVSEKDSNDISKPDSLIPNKYDGFITSDVNIIDALKSCFNYKDIQIIYVGIPESKIPTIVEGKISYVNLNNNLRAKNVKFKTENGRFYHVYVIFDRITGEVVDVANDERYIISLEKPDTLVSHNTEKNA